MKKNGFTLVEILVVIAIVATIGTIMVLIFTNTLRGSNKSQMLAVIKQNGQAVLENMDKTIRGSANPVICPANSGITLVVDTNGGTYTRYRFIPPNNINPATGNCGNANGCIQQDHPVFSVAICSDSDSLISPLTLTDTSLQSGVSVSNGLFTRNKQSGFHDSVTVSFTLRPGIGLPVALASQIDPVAFQTTIELR